MTEKCLDCCQLLLLINSTKQWTAYFLICWHGMKNILLHNSKPCKENQDTFSLYSHLFYVSFQQLYFEVGAIHGPPQNGIVEIFKAISKKYILYCLVHFSWYCASISTIKGPLIITKLTLCKSTTFKCKIWCHATLCPIYGEDGKHKRENTISNYIFYITTFFYQSNRSKT